MRTTVDLPDALFRKLKTRAARDGVKMKELLTAFIDEGLRTETSAPAHPPRARSPLPIARRKTGVPIPGLTNSQIDELFDREDAHGRH